jgi:hypothetical protein
MHGTSRCHSTLAHPSIVTAAAFAASGQEAWTVGVGAAQRRDIQLAGPGSAFAAHTEAARELLVQRAVYDPARNLIYAGDRARHVVVVIDR